LLDQPALARHPERAGQALKKLWKMFDVTIEGTQLAHAAIGADGSVRDGQLGNISRQRDANCS
jgi:hypothetical protein